jgi:hypothetical protein
MSTRRCSQRITTSAQPLLGGYLPRVSVGFLIARLRCAAWAIVAVAPTVNPKAVRRPASASAGAPRLVASLLPQHLYHHLRRHILFPLPPSSLLLLHPSHPHSSSSLNSSARLHRRRNFASLYTSPKPVSARSGGSILTMKSALLTAAALIGSAQAGVHKMKLNKVPLEEQLVRCNTRLYADNPLTISSGVFHRRAAGSAPWPEVPRRPPSHQPRRRHLQRAGSQGRRRPPCARYQLHERPV